MDAMKRAKYLSIDMERVKEIIFSTKIVNLRGILTQKESNNRLAGYVQDADLSNFGMTDFFITRDLVKSDLRVSNELEFLKESLLFIKNHNWKTKAARKMFEAQKKKNVKQLEQLIKNS